MASPVGEDAAVCLWREQYAYYSHWVAQFGVYGILQTYDMFSAARLHRDAGSGEAGR